MSKLNDYQTFIAIVECSSLTLAANQLHRSVSAVSKQLTKLESHLGVKLIERSTQSLAITELGQGFYYQCKNILASIEHAEQRVKDELITPTGKLILSFPEVLLRTGFMDLLQEFNQKYPLINMDFRVSNQIDDIVDQQIDFAFR
ncbi:MAG: LysR family transcriptional regulator, partial [Paraglaciecola sp.]|nr:LysR family transcriptional regulator [Paraglaciecola sp.]